jgi:membrane protein YdbS with pleckstrin-like domain
MPSPSADAERLFADPDCEWRPVSARLLTLRRIAPTVLFGAAVLAGVVSIILDAWVVALPFCAAALACVVWWWWLARNVAAWRYAEREEDLLVSRGRLLRKLTVVPYGRMQVIDVESGPLEAHFGLATVELVTASASTDAKIPGLPLAVAHDLRNRLTAKGEATAAGL